MKIFEKIAYTDRGPMDKGDCVGYVKATTEEEAYRILKINNGYVRLYEISPEELKKRKEIAVKNLLMFDI